MKFYTSVERYGNRILYRGYDGAERIQKRVPFKPTLFVDGKGDWSTLEGKQVAPLELDSMKDATDFLKRYENIDTVKIYGMNIWCISSSLMHSPMISTLTPTRL